MAPIAYWENMFPTAAGGGQTATQVMADAFMGNAPDYITALWTTPISSASRPARRPASSRSSTQQYDSLAVQSSMADRATTRCRWRCGAGSPTATSSTSTTLRASPRTTDRRWSAARTFGNFGSGGYSGFLVNSWDPDQQYSYADFDVRHQINVNGLYELPFGQGKKWGTNATAS